MGDKIIFKKIKRENIFNESFIDFKENNEIEFKSMGSSNIAILYGPNGTGKTSLAKTLDSDNKKLLNQEIRVKYKKKEYSEKDNNIFHVINDQNNRNIIAGETSDYFIGDNIKRECELKAYIDGEFKKLFEDKILKSLKGKYNISNGKSELINCIKDITIQGFVKDIVNTKSKGSKIDKEYFIKKTEEIELKIIDSKFNNEEYEYVIQHFTDKKSIIYRINDIEDIKMCKDVRKIEESEVALDVLDRFNYIDECVVCDNSINRKELSERKKKIKENIISKMDEKTKGIINDIIALVNKEGSDPLKIKDILLEAINLGEMSRVTSLKDKIGYYLSILSDQINNLFKQCLDGSDLKEKYKEYVYILQEKPEITDEEVLFIQEIVSENIGKKIELQRDKNEGNKFNLFLDGEDILNVERDRLHLSNGEQNFISLAFEFLKAKKSEAPIVILDDPISSFDSIYKNKIAFCIIRFLQNKNVLVLTHNTDLIRLLEYQLKSCFNLYIFNNSDDASNGFIKIAKKEQDIFLNLDKLLKLFRGDIFNEIKNERLYLISMISFMRGYANIIGDSNSYQQLSKVMHGYENEEINLTSIYNELFKGKSNIKTQYEISVYDIINLELDDVEIINNDNYPLLNRTLIHTLNYLILRLKVEKVLIDIYNVDVKPNMKLQEIIMSAFKENKDDSYEINKKKINNRVFFTSRKTLLNEFNHFEGNMNIFQPAIDITNKALIQERESIINKLKELYIIITEEEVACGIK